MPSRRCQRPCTLRLKAVAAQAQPASTAACQAQQVYAVTNAQWQRPPTPTAAGAADKSGQRPPKPRCLEAAADQAQQAASSVNQTSKPAAEVATTAIAGKKYLLASLREICWRKIGGLSR